MQGSRVSRRTFVTVCAGAGVATFAVSAHLPYSVNLATAGVLPDAMNRIRHANPGKVTNRIELVMPNTLWVRLIGPGSHAYQVASWKAGRVRTPDPDYPGGPVPMGEQTFGLDRELPLIGDLVAAAGRAHPEGGALVPDVAHMVLTGMGAQLLATVDFKPTKHIPALQVELGVGERIYPRSVQQAS